MLGAQRYDAELAAANVQKPENIRALAVARSLYKRLWNIAREVA
jgi:hypothetical protein